MVCKSWVSIAVILIYVLFQSFFALAAEKDSAGFCDEAVTVVEMRICLSQRLEKAEVLMHNRLKRLMSRLTSGQKAHLHQAQKAWLVYRDQSAVFAASSEEGGTLHPVEELLVKTAMTEKRIVELEEFFLRFGDKEFK